MTHDSTFVTHLSEISVNCGLTRDSSTSQLYCQRLWWSKYCVSVQCREIGQYCHRLAQSTLPPPPESCFSVITVRVCIQGSSKRMSPKKERLRAMPGESCCAAGESKQDVDQWTQVVEGVVLPERVISELVIRSICHFRSLQWTCSNAVLLFADVTTVVINSGCLAWRSAWRWLTERRTFATAIVPYSSLIMLSPCETQHCILVVVACCQLNCLLSEVFTVNVLCCWNDKVRVNPFNTSCSKLLLFEVFSAILV